MLEQHPLSPHLFESNETTSTLHCTIGAHRTYDQIIEFSCYKLVDIVHRRRVWDRLTVDGTRNLMDSYTSKN
jgi:hypothetical protein